MNLLLAMLIAQAPTLDATIEAFLKGDEAARAELLKIGAPAIRPLRQVRDRAGGSVDALTQEIKIRVAFPRRLEFPKWRDGSTWAISLTLERSTDLHSMAQVFQRQGVPIFSDSFDPSRLLSREIRTPGGNAMDVLEQLCRQTGLDYGFFHGMVVIGMPERLWPGRPSAKPPALDEAALKRVRELIEKLGDESIEVRESAGRELAEMGPAILPHLEAQLTSPDKEIAARCEAIVRRLRKPRESAFGPPACLLQELSEAHRAFLKELQGIQPGGAYSNVTLGQIAADMKKAHGVDFVMAEHVSRVKVSIHAGDHSLIEFLSLVTQSRDLDFILRDRKIVIDAYDALEKFRTEPK